MKAPSIKPGKASATCRLVYAPPDPPVLMVKKGTPKVLMKCSLPIIALSPATNGLQWFDGFCSVLMKSAYPWERYRSCRTLTPSCVPWVYQPPGQPAPCIATKRLFRPCGGVKGEGSGSEVGSKRIAF